MQKTLTKVATKVDRMDSKIDKAVSQAKEAVSEAKEAKERATQAEEKTDKVKSGLEKMRTDIKIWTEDLKETMAEVLGHVVKEERVKKVVEDVFSDRFPPLAASGDSGQVSRLHSWTWWERRKVK